MSQDLTLICQSNQRRQKVRQSPFWGLDYLEVSQDQHHLTLFFLGKLPPEFYPDEDKGESSQAHAARVRPFFRIEGGQRIRDIQVVNVELCDQPDETVDDCFILTVDRPGDFSTYQMCVVELDDNGRSTGRPYPGFDPRYACLEFSFKVNCPSDLDCQETNLCLPETAVEPEINYLAKDYASFRQLILDRLALLMPGWQERHVPDLGIALVELLAYTGDYLSYYQDAVATEAYLDTARRRISVRRHARLVDYAIHEGCNARAWLHLEVDGNPKLDADDVFFSTGLEETGLPGGIVVAWEDLRPLPTNQYELFAPLVPRPYRKYHALREQQQWAIKPADQVITTIQLYENHNHIRFYTWGDQECCLPKGATSATLYDGRAVAVEREGAEDVKQTAVQQTYHNTKPQEPPTQEFTYQRVLHELKIGDFLLFEEVKGAKTGTPADANPTHRHVVRLTKVEKTADDLYQQPVLEITWNEEDALPFPLCLSAVSHPPDCQPLNDVSVARGNIILVDHGRPVCDEELGCVPLQPTAADCECGRLSDTLQIPGPFRPQLQHSPLVFSQPLPEQNAAATGLLYQEPRRALPAIQLLSLAAVPGLSDAPLPATLWEAQPDLLNSATHNLHFVAEIEEDGRATLRFGNGKLGERPFANHCFLATYRTGGGPPGNVGAAAISHLVYQKERPVGIRQIWNPLPATGGTAPEPLSEAKRFAPHTFRQRLERAITADDYAAIVMRDFPLVQRAAALLRPMSGWYEVLVTVDTYRSLKANQSLLNQIANHLHRYRRIGHEVVVNAAQHVPLEIKLHVCVLPHHQRGHVKAALPDRFSSGRQRNGQPGFFHPDNLTFGEGITLSTLMATAQAVPGVASVMVKMLQRFNQPSHQAIESGILPLGPQEVARLDNDPTMLENGQFALEMEGGR